LDKNQLTARIHNAGDILRTLNPELPLKPENLQAAAKEAGLPELTLPNDRLADAIFIAGRCPGAEEQLDELIDVVHERCFGPTNTIH